LPNQEADTAIGLLVPAHTPEAVIARLHGEISKGMAQPDVREKLTTLGFEAIVSTPEEFAARIKTEIPKWQKVIQTAGIKPQ